ncbi:hypothetical protein CARUB_v10011159mg [Capsella rubella]|uniref:Uncharacterized protein n=1 Tax=Capsella rubella TaxID=81985 RepID=R0I2Q7_9BRAS|nr:hypothetical protein CARUB_v10011159mg [Capsella rubella]
MIEICKQGDHRMLRLETCCFDSICVFIESGSQCLPYDDSRFSIVHKDLDQEDFLTIIKKEEGSCSISITTFIT